ncbi:MAG: SIMPL domain-containing protein [Polyangiales bacterium]
MPAEDWNQDRKTLMHALALCALVGAVLLGVMVLSKIKAYRYIGLAAPMQTTISVSGEGETYAAPDIAEISFSVVAQAKTVADAQEKVRATTEAITQFLSDSSIAQKDVKTLSYNFYPKYEWHQTRTNDCGNYPCPPEGKQVLVGYEASQTIAIKVRKMDDAGKILAGLGERGATNLSGVSFLVDEDDAARAEARKLAIADAKGKADVLARQLGVELVRIVSFNEGGDFPAAQYGRAEMAMATGEAPRAKDAIVPAGENRYVSNVTIVYEIK